MVLLKCNNTFSVTVNFFCVKPDHNLSLNSKSAVNITKKKPRNNAVSANEYFSAGLKIYIVWEDLPLYVKVNQQHIFIMFIENV